MEAKFGEVAKAQRRLPKIEAGLHAAEVSISWVHVFMFILNQLFAGSVQRGL